MKTSILKLIGRSPVRGLRKHLKLTEEMLMKLEPFFHAIFSKDYHVAQEIFDEMLNIERAADRRKDKVRRLMNKQLMMAFPRGEILYMLNAQEKILNLLRDTAATLVGRKIVIPPQVEPTFFEFLNAVLNCMRKFNKAILELDDLVETGFGHIFREHVINAAHDIDQLEQKVDDIEVVLRHTLFLVESSFNQIDLIFMYQSIDKLSRVANILEELGGRLIMLVNN
ncbi:MAG: DUF47 family protein [Gammaproteobacteria bacterium]|nr:DUF47 family protein [Gammaproteobacteria bacterium]